MDAQASKQKKVGKKEKEIIRRKNLNKKGRMHERGKREKPRASQCERGDISKKGKKYRRPLKGVCLKNRVSGRIAGGPV